MFGLAFIVPLVTLIILGVGVGITMAVVSNAFVKGVIFLTSSYNSNQLLTFTLQDHQFSLMPLVVIIFAAFSGHNAEAPIHD